MLCFRFGGYDSRVLMMAWWPINLRDGYARSIPEHQRRVVWDRWYMSKRSARIDLLLIMRIFEDIQNFLT